MNKILTLFASVLVCTMSMAQKPEAVFKEAASAILIDGVVDEVWADANEYKIDQPFLEETATIGNSTFKALWADSGIFVLVMVDDDAFLPHYAVEPAGNRWDYDNIELYFDVNYTLNDGLGTKDGKGHHQFAPQYEPDELDGEMVTEENNVVHAFKVTGATVVAEYYVPFGTLLDENDITLDRTAEFGFDVTIIDRDPGDEARKRMVWASDGTVDECYNNMDGAGLATLDGAEGLIYIDEITLAGGTVIDKNNGTLQLTSTIDPVNATIKTLKWSVSPANAATITANGVLKAVRDGEVTVTVAATDGNYAEATHVVTISNQILTLDEANLIRNGNFDEGNVEEWGNYIEGDAGVPAVVEDMGEDGNVVKLSPKLTAEQWHYQFTQQALGATKDSSYIFRFKAWSTGERPTVVDFEDSANGYYRYGATTSPLSSDGRSEWHFNATAEKAWYEFDVTFDALLENTVEQVGFLLSTSDLPLYLDSIYLVSASDFDIIGEEDATPINRVEVSSMDVYPNPVGNGNKLTVELEKANMDVTIYNTLGQRVMMKRANKNIVTFDVAQLPKGIYVVRLDDGATQKFIK